jgi:hypothetical protein
MSAAIGMSKQIFQVMPHHLHTPWPPLMPVNFQRAVSNAQEMANSHSLTPQRNYLIL